jgi:hypothetical protein
VEELVLRLASDGYGVAFPFQCREDAVCVFLMRDGGYLD